MIVPLDFLDESLGLCRPLVLVFEESPLTETEDEDEDEEVVVVELERSSAGVEGTVD